MATYVNLYKFTEKGMQTIKETTKRFEAAKKAAAQAGVTLKDAYWLQGKYDLVVISEAPDEIAATAFQLERRQARQHPRRRRCALSRPPRWTRSWRKCRRPSRLKRPRSASAAVALQTRPLGRVSFLRRQGRPRDLFAKGAPASRVLFNKA